MSDTTKSVDELREEMAGILYSDKSVMTSELNKLLNLVATKLQEAEIRARIEGAIMGANFGNAAFRQYNIANPGKPINLDTTRKMGIEQATEWAKRHVE